jgi:hypothetical protein
MKQDKLEDALANAGELMVVLESDREYDLHPHDTEIVDGYVYTEGMKHGDYLEVTFPVERVEHYYLHREA